MCISTPRSAPSRRCRAPPSASAARQARATRSPRAQRPPRWAGETPQGYRRRDAPPRGSWQKTRRPAPERQGSPSKTSLSPSRDALDSLLANGRADPHVHTTHDTRHATRYVVFPAPRTKNMTTERITFPGHSGATLAARLDLPDGPHLATALFAHCFTCSKDIPAARRIAARLASMGIAVLRFDFTGLGHSKGEFANTTFSSNVGDLEAAAEGHDALPAHRALPWRRGRLACGQRPEGNQGGGDHRDAVRSGTCDA